METCRLGMAILPCPAPSSFAPRGFSLPRKGGGTGKGQDFNPAPQGGTGMGLYFLDLPRPALLRVIIVNFSYHKTYYLNKHININLFYSTQCSSLPLFCYVLYYEIFFFFYDCLVKHLDILFNFF